MKLSVLIPTYNSSATIRATLESVLRQTVRPDEILVLDDGSTDQTVSILTSYESRITLFQQPNKGVAGARNALCERAQGELIAFVDHDDIWHPEYLEVQRELFERYPEAAAFFTGHTNFVGYEEYDWDGALADNRCDVELLDPLEFLVRYNVTTGPFGSMSYCSVPRRTLVDLGKQPFRVSGVDDSHFCTLLPLLGRPVAYAQRPLVAYRITREAQSTDKLKACGLWVEVFQLLEQSYRDRADVDLRNVFELAFASKRRYYAKRLMGADMVQEARRQLSLSLRNSSHLSSITKSLMYLCSTYLPRSLQPSWLPRNREWKISENA